MMKVSDEQLSAFLDAELPEPEMEWIRNQLIDDEELANRLAELAMVDEQIASHYKRIDETPLPQSITKLLEQEPKTAKIIHFPVRKKLQKLFQPQVAAACAVVAIVFGSWQFMSGKEENDNWAAIAQVLDTQISGNTKILADGSQVKSRLTFLNQQGNYCRQFQIINQDKSSENIACRNKEQWELQISLAQKITNEGDYQTATGGSALDSTIDEMLNGDVFDLSAEEKTIANNWNRYQE